jgi:hypothetical protein
MQRGILLWNDGKRLERDRQQIYYTVNALTAIEVFTLK